MSRIEKVSLYHGDCLIEHEHIEDGSVDLILTDLPYGNMKGAQLDGWGGEKTEWDMAIEPEHVYKVANRILRKNGKMVLFSQEPYTTKMISEAISNTPVSYRMIWLKDHFANSLIAKKAPVSYFEDVIVFSKNHEYEGLHPLREYFKNIHGYIGTTKKQLIDTIGQRVDHTFRTNSSQYGLCTEETYKEIINHYDIDEMNGFKPYNELKQIDDTFKESVASTFNLWEGNKYKSNILEYAKDYTGHHPTQKPILLLEDLIKTFSNKGDLVVDLTMGSGSTGVACVNTSRRFAGIEMDDEYFNIAKERIEGAENKDQTNIFDYL